MRTAQKTIRLARGLRAALSPPEVLLWARLRSHRSHGIRIRRQHAVGPYVLDFYCSAARLAFEVDGIGLAMGDRPERGERRYAWLAEQKIRVVRIPASEVMRDLDGVAQGICSMVLDAWTG